MRYADVVLVLPPYLPTLLGAALCNYVSPLHSALITRLSAISILAACAVVIVGAQLGGG